LGADDDHGDCCSGRSAVVPAVQCPVQDDNIAGTEDLLAVFELEADGAVQDDVKVQRGRCVHPGTLWISELRHGVYDVVVKIVLVARRQLDDCDAATAWRRRRAAPSRLVPRIREVCDIVPAPDDVEEATGVAEVDGVCVIVAYDARPPALIMPGNYPSNHAAPCAEIVGAHRLPDPVAIARTELPFCSA
jgi:hypothetical protein